MKLHTPRLCPWCNRTIAFNQTLKAVTLLVGYFILGPSELYKLTKEIGKFIQNFRTFGSEASKTFETTMEDQLQLTELRKAQEELNNAFSFRRSINVDQEAEAFSAVPPMSAETTATATATAAASVASTTDTTTPKKKKRRRVKKKKAAPDQPAVVTATPENVEPLPPFAGDIPDFSEDFKEEVREQLKYTRPPPTQSEEDFKARLREERMQRLETGTQQPSSRPDWFAASEAEVADEVLGQKTAEFQSRFAAQLSGDWNDQILANEDKLSPLAKIMERLAILEEEKNAANARLEEEFRMRSDIEERYYREKRDILENAAAEVQAEAYAKVEDGDGDDDDEKKSKTLKSDQKGEEVVLKGEKKEVNGTVATSK